MAVVTSEGMPLGTPAPRFALPGVDGRTWSIDDFEDARVLVVVFTCNHCPYAVAAEDRLIALANDTAERGVRVVAINPNDGDRYPEDAFPRMVERARDKAFPFPYLQDETQDVARAYRAVCTPDPFVFGADRRLVYNGRVDDDWKRPERATHHDLRAAVDAALAGDPVSFEPTPSIGCSIKWRF